MAREKAKTGPVDAAASYRDPRAVPLRDVAKLLDLVDAELDDDQLRDEIAAPHLRNGRFRIIAYQKPRRQSDEPVLVVAELIKVAFQDLRSDLVFDPVHDRLLFRPRVIGKPRRRSLAIPGKMEEDRELQRLMALPSAIDWTGCALRAGRFAFINCKAIRAEDLLMEKPEAKVAPAGQRRPSRRRRRPAPRDAVQRLQMMVGALPGAAGLTAWELAEKIAAIHPEVLHSDSDGNVVNADGWWSSATLERYLSDYRS